MNRPLFIIIGAILVFILLGVWIYVLFFGSPSNKPADSFADFNIGDTTDTSIPINDPLQTDQPTVDVAGPKRLRQLTTEPVVGYQEVSYNASSTPKILYISAGTGHIYSIDSLTGEEEQLSKTTFKGSSAGVITPNGKFTLIQSGSGLGGHFYVGEISSENKAVDSHEINEDIISFKATSDNTFLYAIQTNTSVIGKHYYPISGTAETIFTIPFREAAIDWGETALDTHYTYPKASSKLEGFVYQIKDGGLQRLPVDGFGLSAEGNTSAVLFSKVVDGSYQTFILDKEREATTPFVFDTIPEKCASLHQESKNFVCAGETLSDYGNSFPDDWYKGTVSFSDILREITISEYGGLELGFTADIKAESGRSLDIINLNTNEDDSNLYFMNKNDSTLWQYILTTPTNETAIETEVDSE